MYREAVSIQCFGGNSDKAIDAVIEGTRTEQIGNGKVFISDILEYIYIRTDEKGQKAIDYKSSQNPQEPSFMALVTQKIRVSG